MSAMRREEEESRCRHHLGMMVRMSGLTQKQIDQELEWCRGTTSHVLSGRIQLRFRHIVELLDVCGVASEAFFGLIYPGMGASGLRWPEVGEAPAANIQAAFAAIGYPPRAGRRLTPPNPDAAARVEQMFQELLDRMPAFEAMHEGMPQ